MLSSKLGLLRVESMHSLGQSLSRNESIHRPIPCRQILKPSLFPWSSAFFFFPLSFCSSPPPAFHARAGLALGSRLSAACPPELGLAVPRAAPTSACSGGSSGLGACWRAVPLGPARPFGVDAGEFRDFGGDAGVQAQVPGRARATFLKLALCFARESLALSRGSPD